MLTTLKLCNLRNCKKGDFETSPYVDTCKVFRDNKTGNWYDEATGQSVRHHVTPEGAHIDLQSWLEKQYKEAILAWFPGKPVHEVARASKGKTGPTINPKVPTGTAGEKDREASEMRRGYDAHRDVVREVWEKRQELHGYKRFRRKFGPHPVLDAEMRRIEEEKEGLQRKQAEFDRRFNKVKQFAEEDDAWVERWHHRRGRWGRKVLLFRRKEHIFEINNDGLKLDGMFVIVFETPQIKKCIEYANERYLIRPKDWIMAEVETERIGAPIRRYGKKNANGRRIRARRDQREFEEVVLSIIGEMRRIHISVDQIRDDEELCKLYRDEIEAKLK